VLRIRCRKDEQGNVVVCDETMREGSCAMEKRGKGVTGICRDLMPNMMQEPFLTPVTMPGLANLIGFLPSEY
jgi:hypothetical protein